MRHFLKITLFLSFLLSVCLVSSAQEQIGLRLGNYAGINSTFLNPSWAYSSPFQWDINLVSVGLSAQNNYAFVEDSRLGQLFRADELRWRPDITAETILSDSSLMADAFRGNSSRYAYAKAFATLPSVMFRVGAHQFGISIRMRSEGQIPALPGNLSYYALDTLDQDDRLLIDPFNGAAMAWSELGLNYARRFELDNGNSLDLGFNFRFLKGYEAYYFSNNQALDLTLGVGDTAVLGSIDASFGYATNINFDQNGNVEDYKLSQNGSGFGLDLGATYIIPDDFGTAPKMRFGIALIDVGRISFRKNASTHQLQVDNSFLADLGAYEQVNSREELIALASEQVFGDSARSLESSQFSLWLPMAVSLQADVKVIERFFVSASLVRRLAVGTRSLNRANSLAVTPRFETRAFEVGIPLSWVNGRKFRMGTYFRIGPITLGTDKLGGLLKNSSQLDGLDIYASIKVNPFFSTRNKAGRQSGTDVKCYQF